MTDNNKKAFLSAIAKGDIAKAKEIAPKIDTFSRKVSDWIDTIEKKRQMQPGDEKRFEGLFLYFLQRGNRIEGHGKR